MTMTLTEAANRLQILAEAYHAGRVEVSTPLGEMSVNAAVSQLGANSITGYVVSGTEFEALTYAAAFLGVFVESLEP